MSAAVVDSPGVATWAAVLAPRSAVWAVVAVPLSREVHTLYRVTPVRWTVTRSRRGC